MCLWFLLYLKSKAALLCGMRGCWASNRHARAGEWRQSSTLLGDPLISCLACIGGLQLLQLSSILLHSSEPSPAGVKGPRRGLGFRLTLLGERFADRTA